MGIFFSRKEKRKHYNDVAKGNKPVKQNSKYSEKEQRAYARGVAEVLNEDARRYKYKNSTFEERQAYKEQRKQKYNEYQANKDK